MAYVEMAKDAKVMLLTNFLVEAKLFNGSIGDMVDVVYKIWRVPVDWANSLLTRLLTFGIVRYQLKMLGTLQIQHISPSQLSSSIVKAIAVA